jgi:thermolysin
LFVVPAAIIGNSGFTLSDIDNGAVHWNSTILSHAFYLAIEGGQNRTSGQTVQGVGSANRVQIEQVFFRAVRDMLPSTVTFGQVGAILRQASVDLHGASSAATRAVDQALTAVGL